MEDDVGILNELVKFYKRLYTSSNPKIEDIKTYLGNTQMDSILSNIDKDRCEGLITTNECYKVLKHMKNNKSPGLDGIPIEFYKVFWNNISDLLIEVYNESFHEGELSLSQRTAVLALIFKKGDRLLLKNYRPISLATSDYKLLAFVLARRLQNVLDKIIASTQAGYVKKRFIGNNIRLIEDLIDYADNLNNEATIIFLDFKKAFDCVEWNFIFETLKKFNFGKQFIHWIETLYNNPCAKIKNNGYLSETFNLQRGVRQGCPVSALLFILVVEVLALNIKNDNSIKGIQIRTKQGLKETKVGQFADDAFLALDDHISIQRAMVKIEQFSDVAGPELNIDKCEALSMKHEVKIPECLGLKSVITTRCLGIYVGFDKKICLKKNWDEKIENMKKIIDKWKTRELTYFGKIMVIKMLALPKVIFSATNTLTPEYAIDSIEKILYDFLWGKSHKVKKSVVINDICAGGLNMINIRSFFWSLKAAWIGRYLQTHDQQWAILMKHNIDLFHNNLLLHMNFENKQSFPHVTQIAPFYQEVILSFNKSKNTKKPNNQEELLESIIWGNKYLTIKHRANNGQITLYFKNWISQNIIKLRDLLIISGEIDQHYIYQKLVVKARFLFEMHMLLTALQPYKAILGTNIPHQIVYTLTIQPTFNTQENIDISSKKSKFYYKILVQKNSIPPNLDFWKMETNLENIPPIKEIMKAKVIDIKENKVKEFNYKLINRIGACGTLINKWDKTVSSMCVLCGTHETQIHIIYTCPIANCIWAKLSRIVNIPVLKKHILFGFRNSRSLNNLISQIAFSIHKYWIIRTNDKSNPDGKTLLQSVCNDLKYKSCIMQYINEADISQIYHKTSNDLIQQLYR